VSLPGPLMSQPFLAGFAELYALAPLGVEDLVRADPAGWVGI